jgi:hypothetical protein
MGLLEDTRATTRLAWDEEWFKKPWDLALLELEVASKKGKSGVQLLYASRDIAHAIGAKLKSEGFKVTVGTGTASGAKYSNFFVNASWSEV